MFQITHDKLIFESKEMSEKSFDIAFGNLPDTIGYLDIGHVNGRFLAEN